MLKTGDRYQLWELLTAIRKADSILLFAHVSPDGDTIGSMLALYRLLVRLHKPVRMVLDGEIPVNLCFLPHVHEIRKPGDIAAGTDRNARCSVAIAVDVGSAGRMGAGERLFHCADITAQIDHHETNTGYAHINVIDGMAPATAVLVSRIYAELGMGLQTEDAICLYTALSTDTGNFVYKNTNAEAFVLMGRLMDSGLPLEEYSRFLFRQKEKGFVAVLGKALTTLSFLLDGKIAGMHMSFAQIVEAGGRDGDTDGIIDYAIDIVGVKMAYFIREIKGGTVRVNLRSIAPYRVDEIAAAFGGGGHQAAAGCTLNSTLADALERVQAALRNAYERIQHQ